MAFAFEIVTAERQVYTDTADVVIAPGSEGELGILTGHVPLITRLVPGEMTIRRGGQEVHLFIAGGFLEVLPDKVVVLADAAERAEDIDEARAEQSRQRAQQRKLEQTTEVDVARADAALQRSLVRLRVARRRRHERV